MVALGSLLADLRRVARAGLPADAGEQAAGLVQPLGLDQFAAAWFNVTPVHAQAIVAAVIVAGLLAFCLKDAWFRDSAPHLWGGVAIGAAVIGGWLAWPLTQSQPRGLNLLMDLGSAVRARRDNPG